MKIGKLIELLQRAVEKDLDLTEESTVEFFLGESTKQRRLTLDSVGSASATRVDANGQEDVNLMYFELVPVNIMETLASIAGIGEDDISNMEVEGNA